MFTARNLNGLYARADRKVYLSCATKSPLFADSWTNAFPAGVWYIFTSGYPKRLYDDGSGIPGIGTTYRLNHDQELVAFELSKLDSVHVDLAAGEVYCDRWTIAGEDAPDADVLDIHYSLELHTRTIQGRELDVHLGLTPPDPWRAGVEQQSSFVRSVFAATSIGPYLPPARIHNYRRAVAEFAVEGLQELRIPKTWRRFDCYRIHNCGSSILTVWLQQASGAETRYDIPPYEVRAVRRKANGNWLTSWSQASVLNGAPFCHFFPYLTGDIPYFAGGPPQTWSEGAGSLGQALIHERSQGANNLSNPWIVLEWMKALRATLDPRFPYDARGNYGDYYADPADNDALIGDCVHTWGRVRLADEFGTSKIITIKNTGEMIQKLGEEFILAVPSGSDLVVSSGGRWTRIYNVDTSVFTGAQSGTAGNRFWAISTTPAAFSVQYPSFWSISPTDSSAEGQQWKAKAWTVTAPSIFTTIGELRKMVLVELGWLSSVTSQPIPEAFKASEITLTPYGLAMRVPTTLPPYDVAVGYLGVTEYEGINILSEAQDLGLHPREMRWNTSPIESDNYWAGDQHVLLSVPLFDVSYSAYRDIFPAVCPAVSANNPAVWTAYVPAGGPWGYSSMVYDWTLNRVYEISSEGDEFSFGADFWLNKWGGPGGVDASVRIPGRPDLTPQYKAVGHWDGATFVLDQLVPAGLDDIWFDSLKPKRAGSTAMGYGSAIGFDGQTKVHYLPNDGLSVSPYYPTVPMHQKISKTAWLWDLLEYSVGAWTRCYRRVKGERDTPIGQGVTLAECLDAAGRGSEALGECQYLTFEGYSKLLGAGIPVYDDGVAVATPYYVLISDLASFLAARGMAYNLDVVVFPSGPTSGTVSQHRRYAPAETTEDLSLYSVTYAWQRDARHRFVSLRLPGESNA